MLATENFSVIFKDEDFKGFIRKDWSVYSCKVKDFINFLNEAVTVSRN